MSQALSAVKPIDSSVLDRLKAVVGSGGFIENADELAGYVTSWRDDWVGAVPLLLRPKTTAEVAELVKICAETGTAIVPQGGNTGLTGASQPHATMNEVIISTSRSSSDGLDQILYDQPSDWDVVDAVKKVAADRGEPAARDDERSDHLDEPHESGARGRHGQRHDDGRAGGGPAGDPRNRGGA